MHGLQILGRTPLRRQTCRLGFQADAQLQQSDNVSDGGKVNVGNFEITGVLNGQRKGAHPVAGFYQAVRLQTRNGLTHHGTADIKLGHDFGLGGQLVARLDQAVTDAGRQAFHHLIHQAAHTSRPNQRGVSIGHHKRAGQGLGVAGGLTRGLY